MDTYAEELTHLGHYTRTLRKLLPKHYFEPVPARLLWLLPHLAVVVGGTWAIAALPLHWGLNVLISLLIGGSFGCLGFLGHEALHGSVVKTPWLRSLVGQVCLWSFAVGPRLWRRWHNVEHHGHTQHHEDDPDAMGTLEDFHERSELRTLYRIAPWLRAVLMLLSFTFWFTLHGIQILAGRAAESSGRERFLYVLQFVMPMAFWAGILIWLGWPAFVYAYLIPLLVANFQVMSYIATNHLLNPLTPVNDPLANSLSVTTPRWVDALHLNFSHHTEHHIFPAMSGRYAPQIKALCKQLWPDQYHDMPHWKAVLMVCLTPRVYYGYTRLIDPVRRVLYPVVGRGLESGKIETERLES